MTKYTNCSINETAKRILVWAGTKGWNSKVEHNSDVGDRIALMHSELSEALEEYRNGKDITDVYYDTFNSDKPEGFPIELADCIIRILDFCAANNIDIEKAIEIKMEYNETRSFRHGGKRT